jgi:hypothetical protein
MNGREDLEQDERRTDERQRTRESFTMLNRGDERSGCDGKNGRQRAAQDENSPPRSRKWAVGSRKRRKELPFVALAQTHEPDDINPA